MDRLRDRMARELRVRGMAERTVSAYVDDAPLQEILDAHLQREAIGSGPLFLSRIIPGRAVSADNVGRALRAAALEVGIAKTVTPHGLRHAYATHLLERGVSLVLIQKFLGHRNIETTTIYTHLTDGSMGRVHEALGLMTAAL